MASNEWESLPKEIREIMAAHQQAAPVKLGAIAKLLGVTLRASTLPAGISGEIRPNSDAGGFVIKINRHDGARRQRFTAAHEIAHFLLHRDKIGSGISDDVLYRSTLSDKIEAEANRLAADMLMPMKLLEIERNKLELTGTDDVVRDLAEIFNVSEAAMRIRLGLG